MRKDGEFRFRRGSWAGGARSDARPAKKFAVPTSHRNPASGKSGGYVQHMEGDAVHALILWTNQFSLDSRRSTGTVQHAMKISRLVVG
ncbi:MAG: hypothetical protein A4E19_01035 [Nitrospira sp. SG-bin1]|nr:MAG: hypothetical protein A4E19_01035 [Nitrospira sp. SG-bin1]